MANRKVFFQHQGLLDVTTMYLPPGFGYGSNDILIVKLAQPVTGIRPMPIRTSTDPIPNGTAAQIVGFGLSEDCDPQCPGRKRIGFGATQSSCQCPGLGGSSVCFDKDSNPGVEPVGGDSGGPLVIGFTAPFTQPVEVAGTNACGTSDASAYGSVATYSGWIGAHLAFDSTESCGDLPPVGDFPGMEEFFTGTVSATPPQIFVFSFDNLALTGTLRVTMNADEDLQNGLKNFDLYVRLGADPTTTEYDCKSDGPGQYEACQLTDVPSGEWHVMVKSSGQAGGEFQVTATHFPGDTDSDGLLDPFDNCIEVSNASQLDADYDGYGNVCDGDFNQSGTTTAPADQNVLSACFGKTVPYNNGPAQDTTCAESDMDGTGIVGGADFNLFNLEFGTPPGPSGLVCAGTFPCISPSTDLDGDGVLSGEDNCIFAANPNQEDADCNGNGNICNGQFIPPDIYIPPGPSGYSCAGTTPCPADCGA